MQTVETRESETAIGRPPHAREKEKWLHLLDVHAVNGSSCARMCPCTHDVGRSAIVASWRARFAMAPSTLYVSRSRPVDLGKTKRKTNKKKNARSSVTLCEKFAVFFLSRAKRTKLHIRVFRLIKLIYVYLNGAKNRHLKRTLLHWHLQQLYSLGQQRTVSFGSVSVRLIFLNLQLSPPPLSLPLPLAQNP